MEDSLFLKEKPEHHVQELSTRLHFVLVAQTQTYLTFD